MFLSDPALPGRLLPVVIFRSSWSSLVPSNCSLLVKLISRIFCFVILCRRPTSACHCLKIFGDFGRLFTHLVEIFSFEAFDFIIRAVVWVNCVIVISIISSLANVLDCCVRNPHPRVPSPLSGRQKRVPLMSKIFMMKLGQISVGFDKCYLVGYGSSVCKIECDLILYGGKMHVGRQ